ncbi:hypothetical protein PVAP13_7NG317501 [Panicum virgatum]|uniref:Uncharacterized protein n=1 Tax=Panicum virgatum TaxID=38727 RepID=A0A8T0QCA1_PANVG|nr:hypothetical protein PVAP13_7NG317501 [Panicum virgatum]KAG2568456.1 hypothetical protein PVAP13_7NG317501 [Panicum virgatum]
MDLPPSAPPPPPPPPQPTANPGIPGDDGNRTGRVRKGRGVAPPSQEASGPGPLLFTLLPSPSLPVHGLLFSLLIMIHGFLRVETKVEGNQGKPEGSGGCRMRENEAETIDMLICVKI